MEVKDILLALTTYPEATPVSAVDEAVAFAAAVGARISAIACEVKIQAPGNVLAGALLDVAALVAAEAKKSATNAKTLLTAFQDAAEKRGVFEDRILEQCLTSEAPSVLVEYARLRDLTIVPVPVGDYFDQWYAEAIIFGSGHPTLIMPHTRKRAGAFALDVVAVAWDFSRPAARAVADALPLLEQAKKVHVLTVANEKVLEFEAAHFGVRKVFGAPWCRRRLGHRGRCRSPHRRHPRVLCHVVQCGYARHGGVWTLSDSRVHPGWSDQEHAVASAAADFPLALMTCPQPSAKGQAGVCVVSASAGAPTTIAPGVRAPSLQPRT